MILRLACAMALVVLCASAAPAQSVVEQVTDQLQRQGFVVEEVERTWLGRIRVVARTDRFRRELVVVPTTGEILRDYLVNIESGASSGAPLVPRRGASDDDDPIGGDDRGDRDRDDDDRDDDDRDDDDDDDDDDEGDDDDGDDDDD
ncbi:MAG: hypothetical protein AAGI50_05015 [Pseudomonadota bacterium]